MVESDGAATYDARVKVAIYTRLFERWPPRSAAERVQLETNAHWVMLNCTFDEAEADGRSIAEVADDEIDALSDMQ